MCARVRACVCARARACACVCHRGYDGPRRELRRRRSSLSLSRSGMWVCVCVCVCVCARVRACASGTSPRVATALPDRAVPSVHRGYDGPRRELRRRRSSLSLSRSDRTASSTDAAVVVCRRMEVGARVGGHACVHRPVRVSRQPRGARLTPVRPEFRTKFHRNFCQACHEESPERHVQLPSRATSAVNRYDAFKLSKYLGGS